MRALAALVALVAAVSSADAARIRAVEPGAASPGETVTLSGRGLGRVPVSVGAVEAMVVERDRRSLTFVVPMGAATGPTEIVVGKTKRRRRARGNTTAFCVRGPETCNGVDDDCDGAADDGIADVPVGVRAGTSTMVVMRCRGGRFVTDEDDVEAPPPPEPPLVGECIPGAIEACYDGPPGTRGVGACQDGMRECNEDGVFGPCFLQVLPGEEDPGNGIDENCDGRDGPGGGELCIPGALQSCYSGPPATRGVGRCQAGTRQCDESGRYGSCVDQVLPGAETPGNGVDEDCDGFDTPTARQLELVVDPALSPTFQASSVITGAVGFELEPVVDPAEKAFIASLSPAEGHQGETLDVTITGEHTSFLAGLTQAAFGTGVVVNDVTVTSPTQAVANVSIAVEASVGPRVVAVATGREEAVAGNAFAVLAGRGSVSGRVLDADGNPVDGAQVCTSDGAVCTTTDADGRFTLDDVPTSTSRVLVTAAGFDPFSLPVSVGIGAEAPLGDLALAPPDEPPPPPPPNSPPVDGAIASILGRGVTRIGTGGNPARLQKLVRDTIVAVGGTAAGVIGPDGTQQNPLVEGDGIVTLTQQGVEDLGDRLLAGETRALGEILSSFLRGFNYEGNASPRLVDVLAALQARVDAAWADPSIPGAPLVFALFNDGFTASVEPPVVNLDTPLNGLQSYLLITSLYAWVQTVFDAPDEAPPPDGGGDLVARTAAPPPPRASVDADGNNIFSVTWGDVFQQSASFFGPQIKAKAVKLCEGATTAPVRICGPLNPAPCCGNRIVEADNEENCEPRSQGACDDKCRNKFLPAPPGCKHVAQLAEILLSNKTGTLTTASSTFSNFFLSEGVTKANAERLRQTYTSGSFQAGWEAAKKEALRVQLTQKVVGVASGFVKDALSNIKGQLVGTILGLEVDLIIQSLRPNPPFIDSAEQVIDADVGEPSNVVKITFVRSPNDRGESFPDNERWYYQLYRQEAGQVTLVDSGQVRSAGPGPRPTDDPRKLVFYDAAPGEGTYIYRVLAKRLLGEVPYELPPSELDTLIGMAAGFFPAVNFKTPGGVSLIGAGTLKTALDPAGKILKGIKFQSSEFSAPEPIYVQLASSPPRPPANLVADPRSGRAFLSISALNKIFSVRNGQIDLFANAGFKSPEHQAGLAVDDEGNVYADNASSDAQFGGRVFGFAGADGARALVGTVNKYSFLLGFARPVSVVAMAAGPGPDGGALYIADAVDRQVKRLRLDVPFDRAANIAQPVADFAFGGRTSLAVRGDGTVFVSRGNELFMIPSGTRFVDPLFDPAIAPSPFTQISGLSFDTRQNLYVSDANGQFVMMIPRGAQLPRGALAGYDEVEKRKLRVVQGRPRITDASVTFDQRGLVFYDSERVTTEPFGISGQVTDASGAPLPNATLLVEERARLATTDGDGIFVLPGLLQSSDSTVVDVIIRHDGKTQTERVVLDDVGHAVRDFVFDPAPPAGGSGQLDVNPSAPRDAVETDLGPGENVILKLEVDVPRADPDNPAPAEPPPFGVRVLSPVDQLLTPEDTVMVKGFLTDAAVTAAEVLVNGVRHEIPVVDGEFEAEVALAEGDNTIAVEAFDAGPKGAVGRAARDALAKVTTASAAIDTAFGGATGSATGRSGGLAGLLDGIGDRVVPPGLGAVLQNALGDVNGALQRLQQGLAPTLAQQTALGQQRDAVGAQSGGGGLLGNVAGKIRDVLGDNVNCIGGLRTAFQQGAASTQLEVEELSGLVQNLQGMPSGTLPSSFMGGMSQVLGKMGTMLQQVQTENGANLPIQQAELEAQSAQLQQIFDTLSATQKQLAQTAMNAINNLGTRGRGFGSVIPNITGKLTECFGKLGGLAGNTPAETFATPPPGYDIAAPIQQLLGGLSTTLEGVTSKLLAGEAPAANAGAAVETAAFDVEKAIGAPTGGGLFGLKRFISSIKDVLPAELNGVSQVFQQANAELSGPLAALSDGIPAVLALPEDERPPAFGGISGILSSVVGRLEGNLAQRTLPAEGDPAEAQQGMSQVQQMFTTLSDLLRVNRDLTRTAIESLGPDGETTDASVTARLTDMETGLPVAGMELEVEGTPFKATSDVFGVVQVKMLTTQLDALREKILPLLDQLSTNLQSAIEDATEGDRASARASLTQVSLESTDFIGKTPPGLSVQALVDQILGKLNATAGETIAKLDEGNDLAPEDVAVLQARLAELFQQQQQITSTLSAIVKSQHDSGLKVITNIR